MTDTTFGDLDPEDSYDAGDPLRLRVAILRRIVAALRDGPDDGRRDHRRRDALRLLDNLERDTDDLVPALEQIRAELESV